MRRILPLLALVLSGSAAACGADEEAGAPPTTTAVTPAPSVTVKTLEETSKPRPEPTGKPKFRITLTGENGAPTAGRPWRYTVRATTPAGRPASGVAKMRVFVGDELVDTIGFFQFDGTLSRTHRWPDVLRGRENVFLQAEVEGEGGTQRVNFVVDVR